MRNFCLLFVLLLCSCVSENSFNPLKNSDSASVNLALSLQDSKTAESKYFLAVSKLSNGDIEEGLELLRESARSGYDKAECAMGFIYLKGYYVKSDKQTSLYWLKKASEHGNLNAKDLIKLCFDY